MWSEYCERVANERRILAQIGGNPPTARARRQMSFELRRRVFAV
jgi:hypothetical protein